MTRHHFTRSHSSRLGRQVASVLAGAMLAVGLTPFAATAQVVREDGVKSIAGLLSTQPGGADSAEWTLRSSGGEILFATIDGDIYRRATEHTGHLTAGLQPSAGENETDSGPGLFRLRVVDRMGQTVCIAERPAPPPGWQRDPRMACVLPATAAPAVYRLRVELIRSSDHVMAPEYAFLLNLSLRRIARSGTSVQTAIATSNAAPF